MAIRGRPHKVDLGTDMRDEITFPSRIKRIGNAYYIPVYMDYVRSLGAYDGSEIDVHIKVVSRVAEDEETGVKKR